MSDSANIMNDLTQEFAGMRNTIANLVQVIKKYDERIKLLEAKTADVEVKTAEQILLDRFTASSQVNRNLNADPRAVALAAHLYYIKQVPAVRISSYGLLSQSKLYGLTSWDDQHLIDFCELNGVADIYKNGVDDSVAQELFDDWVGMKDYLDSRADDEPKSTKLDKAFEKVNEQHAQPIDLMAE